MLNGEQSEARNFFDMAVKNRSILWLVTHCFSLKMSVNIFKMEIKILK